MQKNQKPTLLLVTSFTYPHHAGGGLNAFNFGKFLISGGFQAEILTLNRGLKLPSQSVIDGLKINRIPYFNNNYLLKIVSLSIILPRYLFGVIRNDIIIIYGGYILAWEFIPLFGRLFQKRVIFRSTMYGEDDIESLLKYNTFLRPVRKLSLSQIQNYIALTPSFSGSFKKYFPTHSNKIIETPQGVNTDMFYPVNESRKLSIRKKLDIRKDAFVIISVGTLLNRKGYHKIYPELAKLDFPFIYIVLGDYDLTSDNFTLKNKLKAREILSMGNNLLGEKIVFKGFVENVNEYLQASDVFLMASSKEGLSNALLEAMACGLAVITRNLNNLQEFLLVNKLNCLFFENEGGIANAIKYVKENPEFRKTIGINAFNAIYGSNSFEHVIKRLEL